MYMDQVHASSCEEQALLGYLRRVNDERGQDQTKNASSQQDLVSPYRNLFPAVSGTPVPPRSLSLSSTPDSKVPTQ